MRVIASMEELRSLVGQEVAVSDWCEVSAERVRQFADATGDRQWIHLDEERCRRESPFGQPVAHGFLTLSLLPALMASALRLPAVRMAVNYGLNKLRFPAPVPVGSRVRAHMTLGSLTAIEDGLQVAWQMTLECEGADKPACVVEQLVRLYL